MKRRSVWVVENRLYVEELGKWSDWSCTFDEDAGPYDNAALARSNAKSLEDAANVQKEERWQYRAVRYDASK